MRRHFVEAQLQIVIGSNPLGCVNGALLQCLVNFTSRNVLRYAVQTAENFAAKTADAHLHALDVGHGLDFLAIPAAHLGARVAHRKIDDVVGLVELAQQLQAIAGKHPGGQLARIEAKRNGTIQGERLILAKEIIGRGMRALNRAVLHAINHTESRHQLASGVHRDCELATGQVADFLGEFFGATNQNIERLGKARRQSPANSTALRMHSRRCTSSEYTGDAGMFN